MAKIKKSLARDANRSLEIGLGPTRLTDERQGYFHLLAAI
jgi:hypothetical protein